MARNERQPTPDTALDGSETQLQTELKRTAHRIAWTRMFGKNDALNPFAETEANQPAPGGVPRE